MAGERRYVGLFSKVRALYAQRLREEDYQKLRSFHSIPEVVSYLKRHQGWRRILSTVDETTVRRGYLEIILNKGFLEEYGRFLTFIPREDRELLGFMIKHKEIDLILSFLRHLAIGDLENFTSNLPAQFDSQSLINLPLLQNATDYQGMLCAVEKTEYFGALTRLTPKEGEEADYSAIELVLWQLYYEHIFKIIRKNYRGNTQKILLDHFGAEADLDNISRVIRLKGNFDIQADDIFDYLLNVYYKVDHDFFRTLFNAEHADFALALLQSSPYRRYFMRRQFRYISEYVDEAMIRQFRKQIFLTPPSVFLGILFIELKSREVLNITRIIESVRYGASLEKLALP